MVVEAIYENMGVRGSIPVNKRLSQLLPRVGGFNDSRLPSGTEAA